MAVIAFFVLSLTLGGLAWRWLRRTNDVAAAQAGETSLFNGFNLDGWEFDPAVWSVGDGVIHGEQKRSGYGRSLIWQGADLADFELRFRFRLVRGNSGIAYRATLLPNLEIGYEFEIYTNKTGNLAHHGPQERRRLYRAESTAPPLDREWHEGVIIANGPRLIHSLDGQVLCDVEDIHPGAPRSGAISFGMSTGTIVEFKDIRLKRTSQIR